MENDIDIKGGYIMHELIAQPKMLLVVIVYLLALVGTGAYFGKQLLKKKEKKIFS